MVRGRRLIGRFRAGLAEREQDASAWLTRAQAAGVSLREEAVTGTMLIGLAEDSRINGIVKTRAFTSKEEVANGADWLWIFRGRSGGRVSIRVQAKRLRDGKYSVNQSAQESQLPLRYQREVLIKAGVRDGIRTAYVFYNDGETIPFAELMRPCEAWDDRIGPLGGISMVDAGVVHDVVKSIKRGKESARRMRDHAWPLSCALLCWNHGQREHVEQPLDLIIANSLTASNILPPQESRGRSVDDPNSTYWNGLVELMRKLQGDDDDGTRHHVEPYDSDGDGAEPLLEEACAQYQLQGIMLVDEIEDSAGQA